MPNTAGGHASNSAASGASLSSGAFSVDPVAGSTVAVALTWVQDTSEVLSSVSDNATPPNTYTLAPGTNIATGGKNTALYYAKNVQNIPAGFAVTASWSGSTLTMRISAVEIKGADTTAPLGQSGGQSQSGVGTGTDAVTSGAVTTGTAGEFIFGLSARSNSVDTFTPGTGFTGLHSFGVVDARSEYQVQSAAGSIAATFTWDASGDATTVIATFKAAGGGATPIAASDSPSVKASESAAMQVGVTPADAVPVKVSELAALAVAMTASDTCSVRVTENASVVISQAIVAADSLGLRLSEAIGPTIVLVTPADTFGVRISDLAALGDTIPISAADTLAIGLTETPDVVVEIGFETISIGLLESAALVVVVNASDTFGVPLADAAAVFSGVTVTVADTLGIRVTEAVPLTVLVTAAMADAVAVNLTESGAALVSVTPSDLAALSVAEVVSLLVAAGVVDTASVRVVDSATVQIPRAAAEALQVALAEAAVVVADIVSAAALTTGPTSLLFLGPNHSLKAL